MWGRFEGFWIKYQCILARNMVLKGFRGGSHGKESTCNAGRPGFDPWVGKIPWSREWQPTPGIPAWRISMDRGAWWATVHGVAKSQT